MLATRVGAGIAAELGSMKVTEQIDALRMSGVLPIDYLIVPRIQGRTVELPALASLVAVLIGGVLLGIVGVLVAIPVAAAIRLLLQEVAFPRLDEI